MSLYPTPHITNCVIVPRPHLTLCHCTPPSPNKLCHCTPPSPNTVSLYPTPLCHCTPTSHYKLCHCTPPSPNKLCHCTPPSPNKLCHCTPPSPNKPSGVRGDSTSVSKKNLLILFRVLCLRGPDKLSQRTVAVLALSSCNVSNAQTQPVYKTG